jgi:succinate dehydrogenase / fumarate reductase cytochrome b subunit
MRPVRSLIHKDVWRRRSIPVVLYLGAFIVMGWVLSLASGPQAYGGYLALLGSPPGRPALLGLTFSVFYHLANGVRHLWWDADKGFGPKVANTTGVAVIAFGVATTVVVWVAAFNIGSLA